MALTGPKSEKTLGDLFGAIVSRWYVVLLSVIVLVAGTLSFDSTRKKMYTSTSVVQLLSQNISSFTGGPSELTPLDISTDMLLLQSSQVTSIVARKLHMVAPSVKVADLNATGVITISATSHVPALAAVIANAYATAYVQFTTERFANQVKRQEHILLAQQALLQAQIANIQQEIAAAGPKSITITSLTSQFNTYEGQLAQSTNQLTTLRVDEVQVPSGALITHTAQIPTAPSSPKPLVDGIIALAVALALSVGLCLILDLLDDRIRSENDLLSVIGDTPLFGQIPLFDNWKSSENKIYAVERPKSKATEAYRSLRTSIQFIGFDSPESQVILFTSPLEGEGKTTTVVDIAAVMASAGRKALLVSCDMRRPQIHRFFNNDNAMGLSTYLTGEHSVADVTLSATGIDGLSVITSGPIPPNPADLLASDRFTTLLAEVRSTYDVILLDSPPLLPVTDAQVLAERANFTVLVVRAQRTPRKAIGRAFEILDAVDTKVGGVVLNAIPKPIKVMYGYGYGYGYGSYGDYTESSSTKRRFGLRKS